MAGLLLVTMQVMLASSPGSAASDISRQLIVPACLEEPPVTPPSGAFKPPSDPTPGPGPGPGRPALTEKSAIRGAPPEAGPFCGPSALAGAGRMLQASLLAPLIEPSELPSDDTGDSAEGVSTSESAVIEIARLVTVRVAAALHEGEGLCELQVRFEGQIQEAR